MWSPVAWVVRCSCSVTGRNDFVASSANCVSVEVIVITLLSLSAVLHIQAIGCATHTGYRLCYTYRLSAVLHIQAIDCATHTGYRLCYTYRLSPVLHIQAIGCTTHTGYRLCYTYRLSPVLHIQAIGCATHTGYRGDCNNIKKKECIASPWQITTE